MKEFSKKEKEDLIVKQLRRQSSMKRILVSDAIASLMVIQCRKLLLLTAGSMKTQQFKDR